MSTAAIRIISVLVVLLGLACGGISDLPRDAELEENFRKNVPHLEALRALAEEDPHLVRIAPDFTWLDTNVSWPRDESQWGISRKRWDEYRRLFKLTGCYQGILRREDQAGAIFFICATRGLVTGGSAKGYAYTAQPLGRVVSNLDGKLDLKQGSYFKAIKGKWFLFLDVDG